MRACAGIFIDGKLACVGAPKALAARYGRHHVFTLTTPEPQLPAAHKFVRCMCPTATCKYEVTGTSKWQLPCADITLSRVFDVMGGATAAGLTVLDWGVHSASLEDVFIHLANEANKNNSSEVVDMP